MPMPTDPHVRFTSPLNDQLPFHRRETEAEPGREFSGNLTLLSARGALVLVDLNGQVVPVELDLPTSEPRGASTSDTWWG
jgi:uncharacterized protein involved in type VI secretion and phage assembly